VRYEVIDASNNDADCSFTVTVACAQDDSTTTIEDKEVIIDVIANDSEVEHVQHRNIHIRGIAMTLMWMLARRLCTADARTHNGFLIMGLLRSKKIPAPRGGKGCFMGRA